MGQSSSRSQRPVPYDARSEMQPEVAGPHREAPATPSASTLRNSRRPSLRKRVVNLIKSGSLRDRDAAAETPAATGERRKSWRSSSRWSKSPVDFYPTQPTVVEGNEEQPPSSPEASSSRIPSTPTIPTYDKGKSREEEDVVVAERELEEPAAAAERPSTPYPATALEAQQQQHLSSQPDPYTQPPLDESDTRTVEQLPRISEPESPVQPETISQPPPLSSSTSSPVIPELRANSPPTRQFPPPGTLVVVQGIVHTTDVSRPALPPPLGYLSHPNENGWASLPPTGAMSEGSSTRARGPLGVFRRVRDPPNAAFASSPSSSSSSPASSPSSSFAHNVPEPLPPPSAPHHHLDQVGPSRGHPEISVGETAPGGEVPGGRFDFDPSLSDPPPPMEASSERTSPRPAHLYANPRSSSAISPGSIDVLGTLLSVAAAATAASLLTGSSEPILSSGLAPPLSPSSLSSSSSPSNATGTSTGRGGPTTPEDTTASIEPNAAEADNASADNYAASRAERMRQAWSTIRERLGLRPNPPSPSQPSPGPNGLAQQPPSSPQQQQHAQENGEAGTGGGSPITDTRELMLAEMARAFNIGLGLNGLGGTGGPAGQGTDPGGEGEQQAGGIGGREQRQQEREQEGGGGASTSSGELPPEGSFDRFLVDLQADLRIALTRDDESAHGEDEGEEAAAPSPPLEEPAPVRSQSRQEEAEEEDDGGGDEMPALQSISSDSDSELSDDEEDSSPLSTPGLLETRPTISTTASNTRTGLGRMDASGRINWWRLYRFPAITSPRTYASMASASPLASSPITPSTSAPSASLLSANLPSTVSLTDFEEEVEMGGPQTRPEYVIDDSTRTRTRVRRGNAAGPIIVDASGSAGESSLPLPPPPPLPLPQVQAQAQHPSPSPFLPGFLPPPSGQTVVPVIVVGLQSVNAAGLGWQGGAGGGAAGLHNHHHHRPEEQNEDEEDYMEDYDYYDPEEDDEDDLDDHMYARSARAAAAARARAASAAAAAAALGVQPESLLPRHNHNFRLPSAPRLEDLDLGSPMYDGHRYPEVDRQRRVGSESSRSPWQRRASSALRNLRAAPPTSPRATRPAPSSPGSGAPSPASLNAAASTTTSSGSRTFLIYVIGGYYPPDHSIVTGGPETFESFEALLELAEMLGHAKPPTATKEEIDKSGLETIKPAMLAAYEARGKIASSCTERCLICLDDYEAEDDVRVMSCRHAFHQVCVDKWLQTGRNNCPACRSTGVPAEA